MTVKIFNVIYEINHFGTRFRRHDGVGLDGIGDFFQP